MDLFLNIDAGEHDDEVDELYALAHVVNVACGGHAGDDASMRRVIAFCNQHEIGPKISIGAHPSFPDRAGFGRVAMTMTEDALLASIAEQCHALATCARAEGDAPIAFAKLHGALYHAADRDEGVARAAVRGVIEALGWEITVIASPFGKMIEVARELGLRCAREGFADRGVREDGSLIPRGEPGAMIEDATLAANRTRVIAETKSFDTICVHGDGKNALAIARAVRKVIDAHR